MVYLPHQCAAGCNYQVAQLIQKQKETRTHAKECSECLGEKRRLFVQRVLVDLDSKNYALRDRVECHTSRSKNIGLGGGLDSIK